MPGHEYAVRIRNCTGGRVLVVTSVDGVNVISGDTAVAAQSGYVLDPWASVEIAGWRKSLDRTAAFYFTDLGDSYAARTGRPQNVGVIGVAVFQERPKRIAYREQDLRGRLGRRRSAPNPRARRTAPKRRRRRRLPRPRARRPASRDSAESVAQPSDYKETRRGSSRSSAPATAATRIRA